MSAELQGVPRSDGPLEKDLQFATPQKPDAGPGAACRQCMCYIPEIERGQRSVHGGASAPCMQGLDRGDLLIQILTGSPIAKSAGGDGLVGWPGHMPLSPFSRAGDVVPLPCHSGTAGTYQDSGASLSSVACICAMLHHNVMCRPKALGHGSWWHAMVMHVDHFKRRLSKPRASCRCSQVQ